MSVLPAAVFILEEQNLVVLEEMIWPTEPKIITVWHVTQLSFSVT